MRIKYHTLDVAPTGDVSPDGFVWMTTRLEGWDSPSIRSSASEPTSRHGGVQDYSLLGPRAIVWSGVCKAFTEAGYWAARNHLAGLTNNIWEERQFTAWEGNVPKTLSCIRAGEVRINPVGVAAFEFEVPLVANDPLKYGEAITTTIAPGQTKTLAQAGTFDTEMITVKTDNTGTVDLGTVDARLVSQSVPISTVFSFRKRTVTKGSVSYYQNVKPTSIWFALSPGNNVVSNQGTASVKLTYQPAWL